MKKIAITGGKGGTGKSTVAVLLAADFLRKGKKVVLVDCDIECPNDYLLIGQKLNKSVKKVYAKFPKLDKKKCKKCGLCVKTCRENAVFSKTWRLSNFYQRIMLGLWSLLDCLSS